MLSQAANARTPLPGVGAIQTASSNFASHAESTRKEAVDALIAARDSFSGAGLRAEDAERVERLTVEINAMIEALGGPAVEPEPAYEDESAVDEESYEEEPATDDEAAPMDDENAESGEG